jgi:hypothetical protein
MDFVFHAAVRAPLRVPGPRKLPPGTPQLTPTVAPSRGLARHLRAKLALR